MRIVAVADTHAFQDALVVPDGDVFVHAGDLLRGGSLDELIRVAAWIRGLPHRHKIVVAGNHDWCFARARDAAVARLGPDVIYLEDAAHELDGVRFWGSPWQPEFFAWAFNLKRGAPLRAKWALIPADTDVLVTHGPPRGFGDDTGRDEAGCDDLLEAVRRVKPRLHLFGHIHEDGGVWRDGDTLICNATTWEGERGATVIDLDPITKTVVPVVVPQKR
jgi:predicted phosphohydrolase